MKIKVPVEEIMDHLGLPRYGEEWVWDVVRIYHRKERKFIPIGWTGNFGKYNTQTPFVVLDSELKI